MGSLDQAGIQRNHIHQVAKAELFLDEFSAHLQHWNGDSGIHNQFHRIVTWLAVDIYAARIIGGFGIVEPEVVGKPGIGIRHDHQIP